MAIQLIKKIVVNLVNDFKKNRENKSDNDFLNDLNKFSDKHQELMIKEFMKRKKKK